MGANTSDLEGTMAKLLEVAPPGAAAAADTVRHAMLASQSAFQDMTRTSRQMSELARAGVKAASDATVAAVEAARKR